MELHLKTEDLEWVEGKIIGFRGKDLISQANGALKLVSVSPLAEYPLHIHPEKTEYIYVLKGEVICTIDNKKFRVAEKEFAIFPKECKHNIRNTTSTESIILVGSIK